MTLDQNYIDWTYGLEWGQTLNFDWFAFRIDRFLKSRFLAHSVVEGRRAEAFTALILWTEAFRQDPAGTLPDDDIQLAQLARFGTDIKGWMEHRDHALYGWQRVHILGERPGFMDHRLGHPVVAAEAMDMWRRKENSAEREEAKKIANARNRVKNQLKHMGFRAASYNNADYVAHVASWLANAGLKITQANVLQATEFLAGQPAEIAAHPQYKKGHGPR